MTDHNTSIRHETILKPIPDRKLKPMSELKFKPIHIEQVPPWNGKKEDRWVFLTLLMMFALAIGLLQWLYPSKHREHVTLPNEIRQQLTSLSNAAEEILLIQELEGQQPSLQSLQEMAIAPFVQIQLGSMAKMHWFEGASCFIGLGQLNGDQADPSGQYFQLILTLKSAEHDGAIVHQEKTPPYTTHWRLFASSSLESALKTTDQLSAQPSCRSSDEMGQIHNAQGAWHTFSSFAHPHST